MKAKIRNISIFSMIFLLLPVTGCKKIIEHTDTDFSWLRNELIAINSSDPAINESSMDSILEKIGDAQIVALGEATHGTSEFWKIRQKITRYLVEKKGFRAILMEASFPASFALHDYITVGSGTLSEAHQTLGSWRYSEMQDFIRWMRQYNIEHPADGNGPALHFYGYDTAFQSWTEAINLILTFLQQVDAGEVENINTRLQNHTKDDAVYLCEFFTGNESLYISRSSPKEYNKIFRIVNNLVSSWEIWNRLSLNRPTLEYRDSVNILNVNCIMTNLLPGCKIVLWAHNGHIRNGYMNDVNGKAKMLGYRLRSQFGSSYYPIATEFYGGHFLAWDECAGHDFLFIDHTVASPPGESYTYRLKQALVPLYYLDLSRINYSDPNSAWIQGPEKVRMIGATYCFNNDLQYYDTLSLPEYYDGIVFVANSHPTTRITF